MSIPIGMEVYTDCNSCPNGCKILKENRWTVLGTSTARAGYVLLRPLGDNQAMIDYNCPQQHVYMTQRLKVVGNELILEEIK